MTRIVPRIIATLTPLVVTSLPLDVSAQNPRSIPGFAVGQSFPTLAFPALEDRRPRSIADFRGNKVILHVFASW
ncbi:MAG: hypothetical protein HY704_07745 [Gemmatimonadetes bacterium]|nr:hypothetical protein [Gemmatimonadota bacterium]